LRRTLSVLFAAFAALLAACGGEKPRSNAPEPVRIGFVDETAGGIEEQRGRVRRDVARGVEQREVTRQPA